MFFLAYRDIMDFVRGSRGAGKVGALSPTLPQYHSNDCSHQEPMLAIILINRIMKQEEQKEQEEQEKKEELLPNAPPLAKGGTGCPPVWVASPLAPVHIASLLLLEMSSSMIWGRPRVDKPMWPMVMGGREGRREGRPMGTVTDQAGGTDLLSEITSTFGGDKYLKLWWPLPKAE